MKGTIKELPPSPTSCSLRPTSPTVLMKYKRIGMRAGWGQVFKFLTQVFVQSPMEFEQVKIHIFDTDITILSYTF